MIDKEEDFTRIFIWILASLVLFTIVIMLLARAIGMDEHSGPMADEDVDARTMPYGTVKVAAGAGAVESKVAATAAGAGAIETEAAATAAGAGAIETEAAATAAGAGAIETEAAATAAGAGAVESEVAATIDGQSLYAACAACHDSGVTGAPVLGDAAAWGPRVAGGIDALLASVINGKGAMPAKGGRADLSTEQIEAIIDYMVAEVKQPGAK